MTLIETAALAGGAAFVFGGAMIALRAGRTGTGFWRIPAVLCALFAGWSFWAIGTEGPLGFWTEHTRNRWGVQIWFDLLLAAGAAWFLAAPEAKRRGMALAPWLALIACTGSIGIMAMLARLQFLREKDAAGRV